MSDSRHSPRRFLKELRRRRVVQVAAVYAAVGWVVIEASSTIAPELLLPEWIPRAVILLVLLGFPVALVLGWAFDVTPHGIRRTEATEADLADDEADHRRRGNEKAAARSISAGTAPRAMAYAGVGILIALVGIGSYAWLQHGSAPEVPADAPRFVAVLPFANTSPDAENEFFADGVTDDILTRLALVPDFSVISRTTTMGYKGSDKSVQEIAEELGVRYVLEGSVRRVEDQVRISAQLVDGRTDRYLWADAYDRRLEDIFAVQAEIARAIVAALETRLSAGVAERVERQPTEDVEAYELFLRGRESFYRYDPEGLGEAMDLYRRALERDPAFALARAWLSRAHALYAINFGMGDAWAETAIAEARQAVADQPDLEDAHTALGTALFYFGRYTEVEAAFERALELNPSDFAAMFNLAETYGRRGLLDEAIHLTKRGMALQGAEYGLWRGNLAWLSLRLGMLDQAENHLEWMLARQPDNRETLNSQGWIGLLRGDRETAVLAAERLVEYGSDDPRSALRAAELFAWSGEIRRARDAAEVAYAGSVTASNYMHLVGVLYGYALEQTGEPEHGSEVLAETERYALERIAAGDEANDLRYSLAGVHALRGETDEAFRWLDEAIDVGWNVAAITASDPLLESLRSDPRFESALDRMEHSLAPMRERVEREGL